MDRPKDMPNRLECAYCSRIHSHGGECPGKNTNRMDDGCLFFKFDVRGCIRTSDLEVPVNLYEDIPPVGFWQNGWTMYGVDTKLKMLSIKGISWDKRKGCLFIKATCEYFINEFSKGYEEYKNKPILKIIK